MQSMIARGIVPTANPVKDEDSVMHYPSCNGIQCVLHSILYEIVCKASRTNITVEIQWLESNDWHGR